jgi:hypothetical protein
LVKMELVFAQSWSKWNWYLLKIEGQKSVNCGEKLASLAYFGRKFFKYAYVSMEKFLAPSPPPPPPPPTVDNISGENFYDWVKILLNVGQNMTTPPRPQMLMP